METQQKELATTILELMSKMNYFTKLKPDAENNSFSVPIKLSSYYELNLTVSSLLKIGISLLKKDISSDVTIDLIILLEIALQLLPDDEMELLDEMREINQHGNANL
ncbi:hypothetical protein IUY40_14000 [Flavobacterium sp. ALJ2]|uniref:hypothetical protein n=1 Tax=Flavobacterium sp. ALJ2 TaxID=2786960 RepID=UPI00189F407D|nr:hypothetical protein [Flavobacterium sp. ALJ2]MBF7092645.1 hypothetical protein [Flavobacterium sp. ALJ2]